MPLRRLVRARWTPRHLRIAAAALVLSGVVGLYALGRVALSLVTPPTTTSDPMGMLHANAAPLPPIVPGKPLQVQHEYGLDAGTFMTTTTFTLHGNTEQRGIHARLLNAGVVDNPQYQEENAMLIVVVFTDRISWGPGRSVEKLFEMLAKTTIKKTSVSLALLTSNMDEFNAVRERLYDYITDYAQFSLLFRNDFKPTTSSLSSRYSMLARYKNFAMLSTLAPWHQHVVYLDPDVYEMPPDLLQEMAASGRDIIAPLNVKTPDPAAETVQYDNRAWVATARQWRAFASDERHVHHRLSTFRDAASEWQALDSVGSKLLYVRADVHRQGVTFPTHSGLTTRDGASDMEAGGLCYAAHFVGYKCWGLPHARVYHHYSDIERWW